MSDLELTEKRYRELKDKVESAKEEASKAQGSLDQLMSRLKDEFDCKTIKEAEKLLADLEESLESQEKKLNKAIAAYESKWKPEEEE